MTFLTFQDPDPTPCATEVDLFASTLMADHLIARELCRTCPFIGACKQLLDEQPRDPNSGPEGTWAGVLVGVKGRPGRRRKKAA